MSRVKEKNQLFVWVRVESRLSEVQWWVESAIIFESSTTLTSTHQVCILKIPYLIFLYPHIVLVAIFARAEIKSAEYEPLSGWVTFTRFAVQEQLEELIKMFTHFTSFGNLSCNSIVGPLLFLCPLLRHVFGHLWTVFALCNAWLICYLRRWGNYLDDWWLYVCCVPLSFGSENKAVHSFYIV